MSYKQRLSGPLGAALIWTIVFILTAAVGSFFQWLFFRNTRDDWTFLLRWPVLWIVYFYFGIAIGEQFSRWLSKRLDL
jgi:hypothetical protein